MKPATVKAAARTGAPARPLRTALSLFTVIPVARDPAVSEDGAARAVLWLPVVGGLLAVAAAGVLAAVQAGGHDGARRLLAATLAVAVLGVLTGGLHLDGLADTADGLGSGRRGAEALAIMHRSDIGPFGVMGLLVVVLVQITALAALTPGMASAAALAAAAVTGRVAVVRATGPGSPPARPSGFGALVAGTASARARAVTAALLLAAVAAGAAGLGGLPLVARALGAVAAGLLAGELLRRLALRRLGGMTGDVFGALIEVGTATVLLVLALTS
jgi:adenosylcobinamide-GDP ribazoletransferase